MNPVISSGNPTEGLADDEGDRDALGLVDADGDLDVEAEGEIEDDGDNDVEADGLIDADGLLEVEAEGLIEALGLVETDADGDVESETDALAENACEIRVSFWRTFVKPGVECRSSPTHSATDPATPENLLSASPLICSKMMFEDAGILAIVYY